MPGLNIIQIFSLAFSLPGDALALHREIPRVIRGYNYGSENQAWSPSSLEDSNQRRGIIASACYYDIKDGLKSFSLFGSIEIMASKNEVRITPIDM